MLFLRQLRAEFVKLFARKRTWMGFAAFFTLELILIGLLQTDSVERNFRSNFERGIGLTGAELVFEQYFRGLTMAFTTISLTTLLLGALFLALVGGDIVSKEVEDGTLRMTLCRPASRLRVLAVKYCTAIAYTFILAIFIGASAIGVGWMWRGFGDMFVFVPDEKLFAAYGTGEALWRLGGTILFFGVSLCTVTSIAFFFSCANVKPAAATVVTLVIMLVDLVLYQVPQLQPFRTWMLNHYMSTCTGIFRDPIPWERMFTDYLWLFGLNGTLVILGAAIFCRRDFKS